MSVFRDELTNLFPDEWPRDRLHDQTYLLSEFLDTLPRVPSGRALGQGPGAGPLPPGVRPEDGRRAQAPHATGLDVEAIGGGCCGMAGAFGFEAGDHYEVSIAVGEHAVLPAVRAAAADTSSWPTGSAVANRSPIRWAARRPPGRRASSALATASTEGGQREQRPGR